MPISFIKPETNDGLESSSENHGRFIISFIELGPVGESIIMIIIENYSFSFFRRRANEV
jgi:hypothetical protein